MTKIPCGEKEMPASSVIWTWRENDSGIKKLSANEQRKQGLIRGFVMVLMAIFFYVMGFHNIAITILLTSLVIAAAATFYPTSVYVSIGRLADALMASVGKIIQYLVLPLVYLFFMAPYGKLFRRGKRNVMRGCGRADTDSYWLVVNREAPRRDKQF